MQVFVSCKFTDVPLEKIHQLIDTVMEILKEQGHSPYCNLVNMSFYNSNNYVTKQIMHYALQMLDKYNYHISVIDKNQVRV